MATWELILWIIWQLPQCLVGALMYPFMKNKKLVRYDNYVWYFEASNMSGGISLGCFVYLSPIQAKHEATIRHEMGHTVQSKLLSWTYLLVIGVPSILWAWLSGDDKCYYSFYTESWANKIAKLDLRHYNGKCYPIIVD